MLGKSLSAQVVVGTAFALLFLVPSRGSAQTLEIVSVSPSANVISAPKTSSVTVTFSEPVDMTTVTSNTFWAFGRWSGTATGTRVVSTDGLTVTLDPDNSFSAGEVVTVILSHDIAAISGALLRSAGYTWQFWAATLPSTGSFAPLDQLSTQAFPGEAVRSYGGFGSDVNGDGFLDICIVNEDSADVRVFLNSANGSGLFQPFLTPPTDINIEASPNEPSDFNRDGVVDFCVCNGSADTVSILLGNGDGTFAPQQQVAVGSAPRGIAVLDVDGDGDTDIVNSNNGSGNLSLLLNNGAGVFGAPSFFNGNVTGEWALNSADMNNDGIPDLVVGALAGQEVAIHLGNGDGTFTNSEIVLGVGGIWMGAVGDVDGDGDVDYCGVDNTGNGALLRGDGLGGLAAPQYNPIDNCGVATDLGDLDGDGDLDWVLSSFCGDFTRLSNDGSGNFSFVEEYPAVSNASCAILLDIDNDDDLDMALVDEIADVVTLLQQLGSPIMPVTEFRRGDINNDGTVQALTDTLFLLNYGFSAGTEPPCFVAADVNADNNVAALTDALALLNFGFNGGPPPPAPGPLDCGPDAVGLAALGCDNSTACP